MPGFRIDAAGGTRTGKHHKAEFRRKHRWRVQVAEGTGLGPSDWLYLQKAARPTFNLEKPEVHHDQEVAYFAGKQTWEPITLTFYDAVQGEGVNDISSVLYNWVNLVVNIPTATVALPSAYKKDLKLQMLAGNGDADETWTLFGCWPQNTNWQDLNYSDTEIQLVEVSLTFDRAQRG